MTFSEQIHDLLVAGAIDGQEIWVLFNLLKCYEQGLIRAEDMQFEINSFTPEFRLEVPQDDYRER